MLKRGLAILRSKHQKLIACFIAVIMVFSVGLGIAASTTTNAATSSTTGQAFGESVATCAIQSVGWVICPVMRTIAQLADYGFAFINQNFLRIEYALTGGSSGIFIAWELVRNIANIVLVLAFLYIVYAQITGRNTGDFNLKRILPRLIIGAILLNLSYYVCAAAIQLSNILGSSIISVMVDVAKRIGTPAMSLTAAADGFQDGILTNLVTTMLSKSGIVWVMMAPMAAVTISIATVSAAILILLIARKVIVSMLVLISPLLFVAYLLPNLERYFVQWGRVFIQLLLLYPVIAFLLGTGQIVSATIIGVGGGDSTNYSVNGDGYTAKNGGSGSATTDLAAAGAAVLPLIGVWWMMKGLSSVMSSAGTRITAGVSRGGRSKERAEKMQAKFGKPPAQTTANNINITGGRVNVFDRKPAFSRVPGRRRRATAGGSNLPLGAQPRREGQQRPNLPNMPQLPQPPQNPLGTALDNMLGANSPNQPQAEQAAEAQKAAELSANITADQTTATVQAVVAATTAAGEDKNKKKNANDAFKSLNQRNKPQSPDAQRSFGTAQAPAGGGGAQAAGAPSVSNRSNDYRAPQIAQTFTPPQQNSAVSERIVTVPVQVDVGSLLHSQQPNPDAPRATAQHHEQTVGVEGKAKGIVNKYLFESARDVDEAEAKLEDLTKKHEDDHPSKDQ